MTKVLGLSHQEDDQCTRVVTPRGWLHYKSCHIKRMSKVQGLSHQEDDQGTRVVTPRGWPKHVIGTGLMLNVGYSHDPSPWMLCLQPSQIAIKRPHVCWHSVYHQCTDVVIGLESGIGVGEHVTPVGGKIVGPPWLCRRNIRTIPRRV